ncbi:hypothetical protein GCM10023170_042050 [Phytohabitans houttuyneae]|uniref:Uncharacterized protein n=1 Tax=Phytohabitans houttuyneae TaxID=1076126 RepID=A0A6V8KJQ1_9ACTN|nr:hypothetical protein Phou_068680 [Phytohabitans houttuyneae]
MLPPLVKGRRADHAGGPGWTLKITQEIDQGRYVSNLSPKREQARKPVRFALLGVA